MKQSTLRHYLVTQKLSLAVKTSRGQFVDCQAASESLIKKARNFYITSCAKHSAAYSLEDAIAGKVSSETVKRRIQKKQSLCPICAKRNKTPSALGHYGPEIYQYMSEKGYFDSSSGSDFPSRSAINAMDRDNDKLKLTCVTPYCRNDNKKTVSDILKENRLTHSPLICKSCAQVENDDNLKYSLQDLIIKTQQDGMKLEAVTHKNIEYSPETNHPCDIKISSSDVCTVTCGTEAHSNRYRGKPKVTTVMSSSYGCPICAKSFSNCELVVLALLTCFWKLSDIKFHFKESWLGRMHLDFYIPRKRLAIEVDGGFHFNEKHPHHNLSTKENDLIKNALCLKEAVELIRVDARYFERSRSSIQTDLISYAHDYIYKSLSEKSPQVFPPEAKNDELLRNHKKQYAQLLPSFRSFVQNQKELEFRKHCENVNIRIHSDFINTVTNIHISCAHIKKSDNIWRRPCDILAGKGIQCCYYSDSRQVATLIKAADLAAQKGRLIDIPRLKQINAEWPAISATTKLAISCPCGRLWSEKATLNGLQSSEKYKRCECAFRIKPSSLLQCYENFDQEIEYTDDVRRVLSAAKIFRDTEMVTRMAILKASIDFPWVGRKTLARKINEDGFNIPEGRITTVQKKLSLTTQEKRVSANYKAFKDRLIKGFYKDFRPIILERKSLTV